MLNDHMAGTYAAARLAGLVGGGSAARPTETQLYSLKQFSSTSHGNIAFWRIPITIMNDLNPKMSVRIKFRIPSNIKQSAVSKIHLK